VEVDNLDARVLQDPHEGCVFSCEAFPVRNGAEEETARELGRRDAREPPKGVCRGRIMDKHTTRHSFVLADRQHLARLPCCKHAHAPCRALRRLVPAGAAS
jgi:hypothetical protein